MKRPFPTGSARHRRPLRPNESFQLMRIPLLAFMPLLALAAFPVTGQRAAPVTVAADSSAALTAAQRTAAIAAIVRHIGERYVFPDRVPAITSRLEEGLASGRYDTDNPIRFANLVTEDLR